MPLTLQNTDLFQLLSAKCQSSEAGPLRGVELISTVELAAQKMGRLLNRSCANFPDYTLHDEEHAVRVVRLMYRILGAETAGRLNIIEIALLILSAYGHDTGMAVGRGRKEDLLNSPEYAEYTARHEGKWRAAQHALARGDADSHARIVDEMFVDFLRSRHHLVSAELMMTEFRDSLVVAEKSLAAACARLCRSHGESVRWVSELEALPFAGEFDADTPFLACVLRLADALDLDSARAPEWLLERVVRPRSEMSWREWRKHQAANFSVSSTAIRFRAEFTDFFDEKAMRDTVAAIEQERREVMEFLHQRKVTAPLTLQLDKSVEAHFVSHGYLFEQFQFELEYREILELLMGSRLYGDERVFIRELLQNSLDACRYSQAAAAKYSRTYAGRIRLRRYTAPGGGEVIEVSDDGSGMTRSVIRDYFMRVGRSYFQSFAFRRQNLDFFPVSQFGIGILSCFMAGDYIEVETCPDPYAHESAPPDERVAIALEIRGPHEFFVVRKSERLDPGTTVRVFLRRPLAESLSAITTRYLGRFPYRVEIEEGGNPPMVFPNHPFGFDDEAFAGKYEDAPEPFTYESKVLTLPGRLGFGLCGAFKFFLFKYQGGCHLFLGEVGHFSEVKFSDAGDTVLGASRLRSRIWQSIAQKMKELQALSRRFNVELQDELENVGKNIHQICKLLEAGGERRLIDARWQSMRAQLIAIRETPDYMSNQACVESEDCLEGVLSELGGSVESGFRINAPAGFITQDGIRLNSLDDLPQRLRLGIGFLYNLDVSGPHRVNLTVSRDDVIADEKLEKLAAVLQEQIGAFLGEWFLDAAVPANEVNAYISNPQLPAALKLAVARSYLEQKN